MRCLVACLVVTIIPAVASARPARPRGDDRFKPPAAKLMRTSSARAGTPVRVFLNRDGGTLAGGPDDPAADRSWIAASGPGGQAQVPAYRGSDRAWRSVVACVRTHFAPFAVDVVDARPAAGDYSMIMVGGQPDVVGMGRGVSGVAAGSSSRLAENA